MDDNKWTKDALSIINEMKEYVWKYITPISLERVDGTGMLLGTGSYIELNGITYILTNEHQ
jgi:hypothetical protein